jgi:hypothetical protein
MKTILIKLLGRTSDLIEVQPVLALFIAGALLAVFVTALMPWKNTSSSNERSLLWTIYHQLMRGTRALAVVLILVAAFSLLRTYLHRSLSTFQHNHGRITEANYNAVQTIWGAEQQQGELRMDVYYDEEVTERIESEDLTKPAILRKKIVRHYAPGNPFVSARHEVALRQNPRKKGSALYGGYETDCRFTWKLKNPADRDMHSTLRFPLPAATAMYDALTATLNGEDVLSKIELKEGTLILARDLAAGENLDLAISFKSRGMSYWYLQVREPREIRDFTLTMTLPDLAKSKLNYPEGCMTPTAIQETTDQRGSVLTYRLDHAISNKGMGISLPALPQPGETTSAVLEEVERGWLLVFAAVVLGLACAPIAHPVLLMVLFATASACGYGLLGELSDVTFGFWGAAAIVLLPLFGLLAWLLVRYAGAIGRMLAFEVLLFGVAYPVVAGLDYDRQGLYLNICAFVFLFFAARQLLARFSEGEDSKQPELALAPA